MPLSPVLLCAQGAHRKTHPHRETGKPRCSLPLLRMSTTGSDSPDTSQRSLHHLPQHASTHYPATHGITCAHACAHSQICTGVHAKRAQISSLARPLGRELPAAAEEPSVALVRPGDLSRFRLGDVGAEAEVDEAAAALAWLLGWPLLLCMLLFEHSRVARAFAPSSSTSTGASGTYSSVLIDTVHAGSSPRGESEVTGWRGPKGRVIPATEIFRRSLVLRREKTAFLTGVGGCEKRELNAHSHHGEADGSDPRKGDLERACPHGHTARRASAHRRRWPTARPAH